MYLGMYMVPTGIVCFLHDTNCSHFKILKICQVSQVSWTEVPWEEMPGEGKETPYNVITVIASYKCDFAEGEAHLCPSSQWWHTILSSQKSFPFPTSHVSPQHLSSLSLPSGLNFLSSLTPNVYCYNINTIADYLILCLKFSISLVPLCISSFWKSTFLARQFIVAIMVTNVWSLSLFSVLVQNKSHFIQETSVCIIHKNRDRRHSPSVGRPQLKKAIY